MRDWALEVALAVSRWLGDWLCRFIRDPMTVVTACLMVLTWRYVVSAARQTKAIRLSAEAAESSAATAKRALTELERPFVFAVVTDLGEGQGIPVRPTVAFFNFGRTPAILTRIRYKVSVAPRGSIATAVDPKSNGGRELPVGIISAPDRPYSEHENLRFAFSPEEETELNGDRASVWITGFIRYDDIFGNHHITGFNQGYDPVGGSWIARGDRQYNYSQTERIEDIPPPSSPSEDAKK